MTTTSRALTEDETLLALLVSASFAAAAGSLAWGFALLLLADQLTEYVTLLPWLVLAFGLIEAWALRELIHARTRDPQEDPPLGRLHADAPAGPTKI